MLVKDNPKSQSRRNKESKRRLVNLGTIEFHSESYNPGFAKRFFDVTKDLTDSAAVADLWLMDIASVLKEFGYEMKIWESTGRQSPIQVYREHQRNLKSLK